MKGFPAVSSRRSQQHPCIVYLLISLWCSLLWSVPSQASSSPAIELDHFKSGALIGPYLWFSRDDTKLREFAQLQDARWQKVAGDMYPGSLGANAFWLKFSINHPDTTASWLLDLDYSLIEKVSLVIKHDGQIIQRKDYQQFQAQPTYHFNNHFQAQLPLTQAGRYDIFIGIESRYSQRSALRLWQQDDYIHHYRLSHLFVIGSLAIIIFTGLYSLLMWLTSRQAIFLIYSCYLGHIGLYIALLFGYIPRLGGDWLPYINQKMLIYCVTVFSVSIVIFIYQLLNRGDYPLWLQRCHKGLLWTFGLYFLALLIFGDSVFSGFQQPLVALSAVLCTVTLVERWTKNTPYSGWVFSAWLCLFSAQTAVALELAGIIAVVPYLLYIIPLAVVLEISVFSTVIGLRFRDEGLEKKSLKTLSETDFLTQIGNRRLFDQLLALSCSAARLKKSSISLIIFDIDHFKIINDRYGHDVGDLCLIAMVERIQSVLTRQGDTLCRIGGEEFAVVLQDIDEQHAFTVAQRIHRSCSPLSIKRAEGDIELTISIGVATTKQVGDSGAQSLIKAADMALYQAKDGGRDQICRQAPPR